MKQTAFKLLAVRIFHILDQRSINHLKQLLLRIIESQFVNLTLQLPLHLKPEINMQINCVIKFHI